ncbi:MAG: tetratricopeptide repeat protein [Proteobacteria bacterium]|nr:tetratricopeptide repeat protein [Pseudomonadota bacterium]
MASGQASRLDRLTGFLGHDPANPALLTDALDAALSENRVEEAQGLADRLAALGQPGPEAANLIGLARMRGGNYPSARAMFEALRAGGHDAPALCFNLAWLAALEGRWADVGPLLDDAVVAALPQAAALKVQALHHLGDYDGAVALGRELAARQPDNDALLGAASVAAMDAGDYALAADLAGRARGGADALTTQGLVALNEDHTGAALALFDRALAEAPQAPRAWLGKGLGLLAAGDANAAAPCLEQGAALFGNHLGSWIAAGWAQFVRGDLAAARRNFETALGHDENFAETHGGLAVLDIAAGAFDSARRRTDVALRLDRNCFGGALARSLLLEHDGKPELAARIREKAMTLPAGVNGKTLAQALAGLNTGAVPGRRRA